MKERNHAYLFGTALTVAALVLTGLAGHQRVAAAQQDRGQAIAAAPCSPLPDRSVVSMIAKHSGKALEVVSGLQGNGVPIVQWAPTAGRTHQLFQLEQLGDGYCRVISMSSGKVLTVAGASTGPGAALVQETWNGRDHQRFRFDQVEPGFLKITVKKGGNSLDVTGGFMDNGTAVILFPGHQGDNQRFQLRGT